jgi:hypothetical protein
VAGGMAQVVKCLPSPKFKSQYYQKKKKKKTLREKMLLYNPRGLVKQGVCGNFFLMPGSM